MSASVPVPPETEDIQNASAPSRFVLEDFRPCRDCHLWKLMMSFYDRKGPESWSQGIVPHFITSNSFIGKSYAKILHGFLFDTMNNQKNDRMKVNRDEKLYIIELGCGSGKFSYYMLKALEEMQPICDFPFENIVYVMTDFTESNFQFWKNHPSLKKYFDNGTLDAAIFDAVNDDKITLWNSGITLEADVCKNPICIIANYLFDTLYHDIFQIENNELREGLISVGSKSADEPDPLEPSIISRLDNHYKYKPIDINYYQNEDGDDAIFASILNWYKDYFGSKNNDASILMPIGALRALRRLVRFSNGKAIVISGDKGNNNPEQFLGLMDPHIAVHGSFSLMVNYHAIGAWFTIKGGFALHNPQEEASLKCSCFVLDESFYADNDNNNNDNNENNENIWLGDNLMLKDSLRTKEYPYLTRAFNDSVDQFGPNDFFVLQKCLKEDCLNPPLRSIVAMLKLSDWDPDVFFKFRDIILNTAPSCGQKLRNDLVRGIERIWINYYQMDTEKDIAFELGRLFYGIREYKSALWYYAESIKTIGEHHVTYHNQGLCHYSLGELVIALENFEHALSLNKDYEKARSWIEKVTKEIECKQKE